jgi:hypothetical protein
VTINIDSYQSESEGSLNNDKSDSITNSQTQLNVSFRQYTIISNNHLIIAAWLNDLRSRRDVLLNQIYKYNLKQ